MTNLDTNLDEVRTLRDTSLRLLPGFWQAREQMDLTIKVLEYFAREAETELKRGPRDRGPMDSAIASHLRVMRHLMSAFVQLHQSPG